MWAKEYIPNTDTVFVRIHKHLIDSSDGTPKKASFSNTPKEGNDLSCDWDKYCTAESSHELIGKQKNSKGEYKDSTQFYIWSFNVGKLRTEIEPPQNVEHDPIYNDPEKEGLPNNRAHSIIIGNKDINNAKFRTKMLRAGTWAIAP